MRLLVVEDDPAFRKITAIALEDAGVEHALAEDGEHGLRLLTETPPGHFDLVLLDVDMPGMTGWELLMEIREKGDEVPVIFVTGSTQPPDRVRGLHMGADDYVNKPVNFDELLARVDAVLRRRRSLPTLEFGDLRMDLARRKVERGARDVELSPREYDLLFALVEADGEPLSRERLLREVWGLDFDPETNVVDVHIGRLRKKLAGSGHALIETVRGQGYRAVRDGAAKA